VTPVEVYDRSDWDFCLAEGCINLFRDGCPGPSSCPNALRLAHGIQIYVAFPGKDAQYVTTKARRH
jgi:hypothetical protein